MRREMEEMPNGLRAKAHGKPKAHGKLKGKRLPRKREVVDGLHL